MELREDYGLGFMLHIVMGFLFYLCDVFFYLDMDRFLCYRLNERRLSFLKYFFASFLLNLLDGAFHIYRLDGYCNEGSDLVGLGAFVFA